MSISFLLAYLGYLGTGLALMGAFLVIYAWVTPYAEVALIRQGNAAAALSFGGGLLGFVLTLVSSVLHTQGLAEFISWGAVAGLVQLLAFRLVQAGLHNIKAHIENNNIAVGLALFSLSLAVGALNAACLS